MKHVFPLCSLFLCCLFLSHGAAPIHAGETSTCEEICDQVYEEALARCAGADGVITDRCEAIANEARAHCLEECRDEPPPEPTCDDRCRARFEAAVAECTDATGNVSEDCVERARAALGECLAHCDEPPPPPPPGCEDRCKRAFQEALEACASGDGIISEECAHAARAALGECLGGCEEPPPPPPTCEELCERRAREVLASCTADDGTVSDECAAEAEAVLARCLGLCNEEPPPPPPDCESRCRLAANAAREMCTADDGTVSEECERKARMVLEHCLALCDQEPPPPPPTCEDLCERRFHEVLRSCTADDGTISDECEERARRVKAECLAICDGEPPPPPSCESLCKQRAEEFVRRCVADGNDPEECAVRGRMILADCLDDHCDDREPPPPPPGCKERCTEAARVSAERCLEAGGDPEECRARAARLLEHCIEGCEDVPPLPCLERCRERIADVLEDCISTAAHEGSVDECRQKVAELFEACRRECEPPPPSPTCEQECRQRAAAVAAECVESGEDPDVCTARAHRVFNACVDERCDREPPPPPPSCEDRCAAHYRELVGACMEEGGTREECAEKHKPSLEECLLRCQDRPPPTCAERCELAAREILEKCLAAVEDGDEDGIARCHRAARQAFESCRSHCERPDPPTCEERCARAARELRAKCQETDDPEACEERVKLVLERCIEGCQPRPEPPSCEERCRNAVEKVFEICLERGNSEEECREIAAAFGRRCADLCDHGPAPSCGSRCTHIARRFFAECVDDAGDDGDRAALVGVANVADVDADTTECREMALEILKRCLARCEHRPRPCGEDCAHRARDVYSTCLERLEDEVAKCVEEGGDERECKARAMAHCRRVTAEFLSRCMEANCPGDPEPPPSCEERCERAVAHFLEECEANGGEDCEAQADELRARCAEHCDRPEPPAPCDIDCEEVAAKLAERCAASDLSPEECEQKVADFLEHCKARLAEACQAEDDETDRAPIAFGRGDVNGDFRFDLSDIIGTLNGLFLGKAHFLTCQDAADANDDGEINVADAVFGLLNLYRGGRPIPAPHGHPDHDATPDTLLCFPRG